MRRLARRLNGLRENIETVGDACRPDPSGFCGASALRLQRRSGDQSLRTGGPLRERSQLQSLQSLQLRAEQRRDRPLRAGNATAGRCGEAFVRRHRSVWVFLSWREKPDRALVVEAIRKGGIVHGASLVRFLIVSNQLSPDPSSTPSPLLILTLRSASSPFTGDRTNRLRGAVHLLLSRRMYWRHSHTVCDRPCRGASYSNSKIYGLASLHLGRKKEPFAALDQ
jgi:hypothetical protein